MRLLGRIEQPRNPSGVGDVGLHGGGTAATAFDLGDHLRRLVAIAGIIDDHGETIARKPQCHGPADTAGGAGDNGILGWNIGHWNVSCPRFGGRYKTLSNRAQLSTGSGRPDKR